MNKIVILVRGACGAGKTHWIAANMTEKDGVIDFANMLEMDYWQRPPTALRKALDMEAEKVYIEALFAPNSPTYNQMMYWLNGDPMIDEVWEIIIHRPSWCCLKGILAGDPAKADKRTMLLNIYWDRFANQPNLNKLVQIKGSSH